MLQNIYLGMEEDSNLWYEKNYSKVRMLETAACQGATENQHLALFPS